MPFKLIGLDVGESRWPNSGIPYCVAAGDSIDIQGAAGLRFRTTEKSRPKLTVERARYGESGHLKFG